MIKWTHLFSNKRMLFVLLMGFCSGLPLALTGVLLQAWLADSKIDLSIIGRFALVGLPYTLKFLWAPLMDEVVPNFFGKKLGRRKGWALITQLGLLTSILVLGLCDPAHHLFLFTIAAFLIAFFSASQDVVLDAYRTELLEPQEMGFGAGVYVMGYRLAMIVSGAVALGMADHMPWFWVYAAMAIILGFGMLTILFAPETNAEKQVLDQQKTKVSFHDRVLNPFLEFFRRPGAIEILSFVMVYKLSTMMATSLTTPFLIELGFTKTEIGAVSKVFGLIATIVGTLSGGALMVRLGLKKALWIFGVAQALAGLSFLALTSLDPASDYKSVMMIIVLTVENFMIGLGVAAISGFMMSICNQQFTATQFALLSSLTAVSRVVLVSQSGSIAQYLGWSQFFIFSVLLAIPGLLLLTRYDQWTLPINDTKNLNVAGSNPLSKFVVIQVAGFMLGLIAIALEPLVFYFSDDRNVASAVAKAGGGLVLMSILLGFIKKKS
jgi:PAT family beta-lactamase induction signal transducer AmpG